MKGHLQPRGDRTWRLYIDASPDPVTGRRRQRTRTFHGTERQARTALAEFITEAAAGDLGDARTITVAQLVTAWLARIEPDLEPNTLRGYRSKIDRHLIPNLGDRRIADLTTHELDSLYARLRATPLKPNTILGVHRILHAALEQAIRWEWLRKNPATGTHLPRPDLEEPADLNPDIVRKAILTAPETLRNIAILAAITGAREAELCGLRWTDLDRTGRTIRFRRRIVYRPGGGYTIRPLTKTRTSRTVGLDRRTVARLRLAHHHARQRAQACEVELAPDAFIFSERADGEPIPPNVIASRWSRHRTKLGLTLTFHQLRHAHASLLLDSGVPLGRVSQRLGHARQSTTSDFYSHVLAPTDHDLAELVARRLR